MSLLSAARSAALRPHTRARVSLEQDTAVDRASAFKGRVDSLADNLRDSGLRDSVTSLESELQRDVMESNVTTSRGSMLADRGDDAANGAALVAGGMTGFLDVLGKAAAVQAGGAAGAAGAGPAALLTARRA